jgi:hydrogenase maturation protease
MKVLILGIGNLLRSDDGVGLHIIEALRKENLDDNVDLLEGLSGLDILDAMNGYDRIIIVDAIQTGSEPGIIHRLSLEDFKDKHTLHLYSTHLNLDFSTMLELGKMLSPGKIPEDIHIIAIEAKDITTISDKCTPKVEQAMPATINLIKEHYLKGLKIII